MRILFKAGLKKQWQSILSIGILFMLMSVAIVTAVSVKHNSKEYISEELDRLGFGDETIWINTSLMDMDYEQNLDKLSNKIRYIHEVEDVQYQRLIFSGYSVLDIRSDDEGQLILYEPDKVSYKFLNADMSDYIVIDEISKGEIYVSPAMAENFNANIGDTIVFRISRNGLATEYKIAGYFEDPFMGSSMIDMKSFLIGEEDFNELASMIQEIGSFQVLARTGAMLHISGDRNLAASELSGKILEESAISPYVEFSYSRESIEGFMLILQNIMVGFLIVFVVILGIISLLIIGKSVATAIEQDYRDMGIVKTIGGDSYLLRAIQIFQYMLGEVVGLGMGVIVSGVLSKLIERQMVSSTGLLILSRINIGVSLFIFAALLIISLLFVFFKTIKIVSITPVQAMTGQIRKSKVKGHKIKIHPCRLALSLSLRQLMSEKRKYAGVLMISMLLVCLIVVVGKMNVWVGQHGEGLMDSFSVAEHDIGVQPNHEMDLSGIEQIIEEYADITYTYELAMQSGTIESIPLTINVLDEPEWFHIIAGRTCKGENEILVTEYVAADLGIEIGDTVTAGTSGKMAEYIVVGIYSCANEMGVNVGMNIDGFARIGNVKDYIWCHHYVLSDSSFNEIIMKELQSRYPMDIDVHTNSWSGLAGIVSIMHLLTIVMYGVVFLVILVVVILTSSKLIQLEQADLSILKSQGLTADRLRTAFCLRFGLTACIGTVMGIILSGVFTDGVIRMLLGSFGISDFHSEFHIGINLGIPLMIVGLFTLTAYIYAARIKKIDIMDLIKRV